jgi:hypothetical protein
VGLENEDNDPIDAGHNTIESKSGMHSAVLPPDGMAVVIMLAVMWRVEGVISSGNDKEEPCDDGENFVGQKIGRRELFAFGERVVWLDVR